jgi:beta-aspartyl-peptidase (threonine type)
MQKFSIAIHGGAGAITDVTKYKESLTDIISQAKDLALQGKSALDVVTETVIMLEDDPIFNAGKGSVLNAEGEIDCDASIMDGSNNHAGAIAGVQGIKNPITLARAVMEKSPHVFMIGHGAETFATHEKITFSPSDYFMTEARVKQLAEAKQKDIITLDHAETVDEKKLGTVGAVMIDQNGNVAAATSTGGVVNKKFGRVGDTPVIGGGTYAENGIGAISCTGYGEQFIQTCLAKHIAEYIRYTQGDAQTAANVGIAYLVEKVQGLGGVIVVDSNYRIGFAHSTPLILGAGVTHNTDPELFF